MGSGSGSTHSGRNGPNKFCINGISTHPTLPHQAPWSLELKILFRLKIEGKKEETNDSQFLTSKRGGLFFHPSPPKKIGLPVWGAGGPRGVSIKVSFGDIFVGQG